MPIKLDVLFDAFEDLAIGDGLFPYECSAYVNKFSGQVRSANPESFSGTDIDFFQGDLEECEKYWETVESEDWIEIPGKKELELNNRLAFRFAEEVIPRSAEKVYNIFRRKGAYSRFKSFLEEKELLEEWYQYEKEATYQALKEWAKENSIELI